MSHLRQWRSEPKTPTSLCSACPLLQVILFLPTPHTQGLHSILLITCTPQEAVPPPFLGIPLALRLFPHILSYVLLKLASAVFRSCPNPHHRGGTTQGNILTGTTWMLITGWESQKEKKKAAMNYLHFNKRPVKILSTIRSNCSRWESEGLGSRYKTMALLTCIFTFMPNYSLTSM